MTEYTEEQKKEIAELMQKTAYETAVHEQDTIALDQYFRLANAYVSQQVQQGIVHQHVLEMGMRLRDSVFKQKAPTTPQENPDGEVKQE